MIIGIILYLVSGVILGNGVPHYVKGITGRPHKTPFRYPSSAPANVLWGSVNFLLGFSLLVFGGSFSVPFWGAGLSVICGLMITGYLLAHHWQNDPKARGEIT
jgi:hypothetical protein